MNPDFKTDNQGGLFNHPIVRRTTLFHVKKILQQIVSLSLIRRRSKSKHTMKCQASQFWVEKLVCSIFIFPSSSYLPTVRDGLAGWGPTWPRKRSLRRRHHWEDLGFSATLGAQQTCKESLVNCYVTVLGWGWGEGTGGVPWLFYGIHQLDLFKSRFLSSAEDRGWSLPNLATWCLHEPTLHRPSLSVQGGPKKRPWHIKFPTKI